ncbi:MAG: hypothetical protein ACW98F_08010 [Candidatus Hodarchaeales archaeon]|jgi:hypothetical protein
MTASAIQSRHAPAIIKSINGLGYLKSWREARGTYSIDLEGLPGEFLNNIVVSKKKIGFAENLWNFSTTSSVLDVQTMADNPEKGIALFKRLKGEECVLTWNGVFNRRPRWTKNPKLLDLFNTSTINLPNNLINRITENFGFDERIKKLKPEKILINISGGVIPPPTEGPKQRYYLHKQREIFEKPLECAWYTVLTQQFYLTRKISQTLERIFLLLNNLIEVQTFITQKAIRELM